VPYEAFLAALVTENPVIWFVAPERGGHCGFIRTTCGVGEIFGR